MSLNIANFSKHQTPHFVKLLHFHDVIRIHSLKKIYGGIRVIWPTNLSKSRSNCTYTNSSLFSSGHGELDTSFFFLWQPFTYLKTGIVHLSLSSLDPLTSDYFATRLVISGHFCVLSLISFKSNLFCTVAS